MFGPKKVWADKKFVPKKSLDRKKNWDEKKCRPKKSLDQKLNKVWFGTFPGMGWWVGVVIIKIKANSVQLS